MTSRRPKILVVEDYAPTRDLVEATLTGSFLRSVAVCDGREALVFLASERPDLVLTDFIMPNVDGLSLARQIRARADLRDLPIVFLTGADSAELREQCREVGVAAVIAKPFKGAELVERLKGILGEAPYEARLPAGWVQMSLGAVAVPDGAANDRIVMPFSPIELGRTEIIKSTPRLVEIRRPEPQIRIEPSPSSWDFIPLGTAIPEPAAVGRTLLCLPHDPGPLVRVRRERPRPVAPRERPPKGWFQRGSGAAELFGAEAAQLQQTVDRRLEQLTAA